MKQSKRETIEDQNRLIGELREQIGEYEQIISELNTELRNKVVCLTKNKKEDYIDVYNERNQFLCSIPLELFEERWVR